MLAAEVSQRPALLLSGAQFAVIAELAGVEPAWQWSHPRLDGEAQAALIAGLRARGVIDADDGLAAALRPLLGVLLHARAVITLTSTNVDRGGTASECGWVVAPPVAVEVTHQGPLLAFAPLEASAVPGRALDQLGLSAADSGKLPDVGEVLELADASDAVPRGAVELRHGGEPAERITILGIGAERRC